MNTSQGAGLNPTEQAQFAAMIERLRQFRRRTGVPDGVTLEEAVALHMISAEEVARARWGPLAPPAPAPIVVVPARSGQEP
jgi:hypothetical protein